MEKEANTTTATSCSSSSHSHTKSSHASSYGNSERTAGSVPAVSLASGEQHNNGLSIQTTKNLMYNFGTNQSNSSISSNKTNQYPVYYQQLMENKMKANLGIYTGQVVANNLHSNSSEGSSPKNASVSSSNGSIDSPSPPTKSNYTSVLPHSKDTSPVSAGYPDFLASSSSDQNHNHFNQQQQKDSTNPTKKIKSTFPFGKCRVCNDKATGIHYGIATCEGCKGFFKRSTLKKEKYRCYFGNNCLLTPKNRNRCKACRFNKCLDVGMSIQGVKMGRIPKIEKEKALLSLKLNCDEDANGNNSSKHVMNRNLNQYDDEEEDEASNDENNEYENDYDADDGEDIDAHTSSNNTTTNNNNNITNHTNSNSPIHQNATQHTISPNSVQLHSTNDHEEMTQAFAKTSVLSDTPGGCPGADLNYNIQLLIAQNNRALVNNNLNSGFKSHESEHHLVKKIRNDEPVSYLTSVQQLQQQSHPSQNGHYDRNEITLFEKLSLSNHTNFSNHQNALTHSNYHRHDSHTKATESDEISQSSDTNNSESDMNETRVSLRLVQKSDDEIELDKELINFTPGYKHISIYELLKTHKPLRSSNIIANCYHSSQINSKLDDSYQIISSLLSDKIYQIHIEHNDKVVKLQERAIRLLYQGVQEYDGHDATIKEVWEGLLESIPQVVKNLIAFAREIPGLNELTQTDFNLIINNKVFDFFILRHAPLFINGESFMMLPNNIQYTRSWMNQVIGNEMTDDLFSFSTRFNKLGLTTKEMALLYPVVLTGNIYEGTFQDMATVQNLNEYYHRALLYEFDLNLRDDEFIRRVNELISELPKLNELQASRIGSLSPQC